MVSPSAKPGKEGKTKGKPRGFRRDRDCLTCKERGVKCDLNRPSCGPCNSASIVCQGYVNRVKWVGGSTSSAKANEPNTTSSVEETSPGLYVTTSNLSQTSELSPSLDGSIPGFPVGFTSPVSQAKQALTSPSTFSVNGEGNNAGWSTGLANYLQYFTSQYTQARLDPDKVKFDAEYTGFVDVWAFAWKRISLRMTGASHNDGLDQDLLYSNALQGLKRSVESGDILALFGITVFAFLDVREGPFGHWTRHLRGARALLDVHCSNFGELSVLYSSTPGLKQAISLLNWYDCMGAVIHKDRGLVFADFHRFEIDPVLFDLVGCPRDTFFVYVRLAEGHMSALSHETYHSSMSQLLNLSHNTTDDRLLLQDAWRYASILVALEELYPNVASEAAPTSTVIADRLCDIVERILPTSAAYIHLPVAVYFIGIHASTERHHEVSQRFWSYFDTNPTPAYPNAQNMSAARRQKRRSRVA
ncbi:uncharacterized protein AB675_5782 [Cyphellophora attinorum]|uniref:Zn(2)-C6 fungal-type domain-containing protein n=1 Tax=Cyphellophora attinorum TaxID=1664694 RepID=A0A0N1H2F6_9EURO|nr:uncharacterized protein AB675_5782 [Phialophora attinorum]KPI38822.1 hypothetical protein AB675_5782 [Phialophora attinorum]